MALGIGHPVVTLQAPVDVAARDDAGAVAHRQGRVLVGVDVAAAPGDGLDVDAVGDDEAQVGVVRQDSTTATGTGPSPSISQHSPASVWPRTSAPWSTSTRISALGFGRVRPCHPAHTSASSASTA